MMVYVNAVSGPFNNRALLNLNRSQELDFEDYLRQALQQIGGW
jgi:hypothetical protein